MKLIDFIKNEPDLRRIFGKKELEIIERQLLGINLKASEKTRLSRDIRKKLEIIQKLAQFSEEFKLKKAANIKELIEESKDIILESKYRPLIKRIILFGSTTQKQLTFRSDIDIAVEFREINLKEATEFRVKLSSRLNDKIDIQVYNVLPEKIKREIDKEGKVIYGQN